MYYVHTTYDTALWQDKSRDEGQGRGKITAKADFWLTNYGTLELARVYNEIKNECDLFNEWRVT